MAAITKIEAFIGTGTNGTDGSVYLGVAGREFNCDRSGRNDFRANTNDHFLFGGSNNVDNPVQPDRNDPAKLLPLTTEDLDLFPTYIRYDGASAWQLKEVTVRVFSNASTIEFKGLPGTQSLFLGNTSGKMLFLKRG